MNELGAMGVAGQVGEQVAKESIDEPRRRGFARLGNEGKGEIELVERILATFVERAVPGWSDR